MQNKSEKAPLRGCYLILGFTGHPHSYCGFAYFKIHSRQGPNGKRMYSFRATRTFRVVGYRDGQWLKILSLHPDHDKAYH